MTKSFPGGSAVQTQDVVDASMERFEGASRPPDFRTAFAKLDKDSLGLLDRPRFALALRSLRPSFELTPSVLRATMDFFEVGHTTDASAAENVDSVRTNGIDYRRVKRGVPSGRSGATMVSRVGHGVSRGRSQVLELSSEIHRRWWPRVDCECFQDVMMTSLERKMVVLRGEC